MPNILLKLSGKTLTGKPLHSVCEAVKLLIEQQYSVVIVHGGGIQLDHLAQQLGIEQKTVAGRRITDAATLDLAKAVFSANGVDLVSGLRAKNVKALTMPAGAIGLVTAKKRPVKRIQSDAGEWLDIDFGFVGDICSVDPGALKPIIAANIVPVISPLAMDDDGQIFNINADTLAAHLAQALKVQEFIIVSDVSGIYADPKDPTTLIETLTRSEAKALSESPTIWGGMRPKLDAIETALRVGVEKVRLCAAKDLVKILQTPNILGMSTTILNSLQ